MTTADMTTATPEANADRLLFWEKEAARLTREASAALTNDEATDALCDEAAEFEARIAEAPCDSHVAATVKLRTVVREAVLGGAMYRIDHAAMIDGIVAFMEGQGATGRAEA
ncbi:hypothetical protein [Brevundimonas naejangsanensis]|uniref:hypothetical protein n=1 Tax=Brevundimonas naejangsanensis TaxID=588932 RepID=UPI000EBD5A18|nr:hypothetical protein [Brevundimonas naejangsanensis]HAC01372.1 hypothetical protein [Brevundimonas sp.]